MTISFARISGAAITLGALSPNAAVPTAIPQKIKIVFEVQDEETKDALVEISQIVVHFDYSGPRPAKAEKDQIDAAFIVAAKHVQKALGTSRRFADEMSAMITSLAAEG